MISALVLACLLQWPQSSRTAAAPPADSLERLVHELDAGVEPAASAAAEQLSELGAPAAARVLSDFETQPFGARRARAKLLLDVPVPRDCARVLELLDDPDPEVRRSCTSWLGKLALAEASAKERVAALEERARRDPSDEVRAAARRALGECTLGEAEAALARLVSDLPVSEAQSAATLLVAQPGARERVLERVQAACAGEAPLPNAVLAALLRGYGRALAEVPHGGRSVRERLPFLRCRNHPAPEVQVAARFALTSFVARAAELTEPERADEVLERLGAEGWPPEECLRQRLDLAWQERGDPAAGLELARALERCAQALAPEEASGWEERALFFEGAAYFAQGDLARADDHFARLAERLENGRVRRFDLFPSPRAFDRLNPGSKLPLWTRAGGVWQIDELHLLALAHLWRALARLAADPHDVRTLDELRQAHQVFLEARVVAMRTDAPEPATLDSLFERDLGPHALVLFNEKLKSVPRTRALDWAKALAEGWASVARYEMLGFTGASDPSRPEDDPLADPGRLAALKALRLAERQQLQRELSLLKELVARGIDPETNRARARNKELQLRVLDSEAGQEKVALEKASGGALTSPELQEIYAQLATYLQPTLHAYSLANVLRAEGRAAEAREISEAALARLRSDPGGANGVLAEWASARFEFLRGSSLMDEGRPEEAEAACLEAVRRLEAIESALQDWRAAASAAEEVRQRDAQVRMIRDLRGDVLLSLAVNANVRQGNPAKALEYFERAYELNKNPFMRVLLACYRARSGKDDEARVVLRGVVPAPSLYYNLACTYALLGEAERALDFLERDFRANYPTEGSFARQREWARKDPDLAALREEPRFTRLLGGGR